MTAQDFRQVGVMVLGASPILLADGLLFPGDVGRALLHGGGAPGTGVVVRR